MTQFLYVVFTALALCVPTAALLALAYLVAALIGWRSKHRGYRLKRFGICLAAVPVFIAVSYGFLFGIALPSLGRDLRAKALAAQQQRADEAAMVRVGQTAPTFVAQDTSGEVFDLSHHQGKIVVLNFFATWCGPCLQELPLLQKLHDKHRDSDKVAFVVVGREETDETVASFQKEHQFTFRMVADPERKIYSQYAKSLIPRTYLIDEQGQIVLALTGFYEDDVKRLAAEIDQRIAR